MQHSFKIELEANGTFTLLILARDGIWDILEEFETKREALSALKEARNETQHHYDDNSDYMAEYAYACGYYD